MPYNASSAIELMLPPMDVKAAVALEAEKPLSIETVQLEGPQEGEV